MFDTPYRYLLLVWPKAEAQAFLARFACGVLAVLAVYVPGVLVTVLPILAHIIYADLVDERAEKPVDHFLGTGQEGPPEDAVAIPLGKQKMLMVALGASGFVALGAALFVLSLGQTAATALIMQLVAGASIIFFGIALILVVGKLLDRQPGLIINTDGILDNSSAVAAGMVPWTEIRGFTTTSMRSQRFITIIVADPEKYVERGRLVQRLANRANLRFYGSPVQISANALKIDFDDLVALLEHRYQTQKEAGLLSAS